MRVGPLVLVVLTALAVVTMHALDREAVHTPLAAAEQQIARVAGHDTDNAGGNNDVALVAASACAFIMLVPAVGALRRRETLRPRYVDRDGAASQVLVGPEPPIPRILFVTS